MVETDLKKLSQKYKGGHVCIVGQGPSLTAGEWDEDGVLKKLANNEAIKPNEADRLLNENPRCRNVGNLEGYKWTLNGGWTAHKSDLGFHMDSMRLVAEDKKRSKEFNERYSQGFKQSTIPIFSSETFEEYPAIIKYPLYEIVERFGTYYFTETIDYMIALAIYWGVKKLSLAGCDYWANERWAAERSSTEYWLMEAHLSGIKIYTQPESFLLKLMHRTDCTPNLYGYREDYYEDFVELNKSIDKGRLRWAS